jgi:uncharacterized protein YkwD
MRLLCAVGMTLLATILFSAALGRAEDKKEPSKFEMTKDEQTLLELTNKEREKEKLPPLKPNALLFQAARAHSANMAKQDKLEHVLDGKNPGQRVKATGYTSSETGENISWGKDITLEGVIKGWMDSKVHRENILKPGFKEIGLGYVRTPNGEVWATQVFAVPRK